MDGMHVVVEKMIGFIKRIGGAALVGMMLVTCVDVVFRAFGRPIFGAVEIVSFMATLVLACAMPMTHYEKGHVGVDLLMRRLSPRTQRRFDAVNSLVTAVLFGLVSWQMFLYSETMRVSGEVSMSLEFPSYILVFSVAVAFGVLSLVILFDFINTLRKTVN